jgi:hypothetical protein
MFDWPVELIQIGSGSYLALELGNRIGGGIVERERDAICSSTRTRARSTTSAFAAPPTGRVPRI